MMAARLLEMRRLLKPTGSLYLHCDPTASHYLKLVLDAVLGRKKFQNEITWKRNSAHNDSKRFGRVSDTILFYGEPIKADAVRVPLDPEYVKQAYRYHEPGKGPFQADNLSAKGLSGGGYFYDFHGHSGPWRYPEHRMRELEEEGRIYIPSRKGGVPRLKRFLSENKGRIPSNIWTDIPPAQGKERTGYPTQKPRALLDRIITASSSPGDMVLDPFCGCATTLVAAELRGREWAGIDLSEKAAELVQLRAEKESEIGGLFKLTHRTKTFPSAPIKASSLPTAHTSIVLFGRQEGRCNGCQFAFPPL